MAISGTHALNSDAKVKRWHSHTVHNRITFAIYKFANIPTRSLTPLQHNYAKLFFHLLPLPSAYFRTNFRPGHMNDTNSWPFSDSLTHTGILKAATTIYCRKSLHTLRLRDCVTILLTCCHDNNILLWKAARSNS